MGNFFSGLAQTAVRAAPFAAQVVAQKEAKDKANLAAALAQLHQQSEDNTKNIAANVAAGVGIANIGHINAETDKLQKPTPKVMRGPGGQLVTYDEDNPTQASTFGPAPIPKAPSAPAIGSPEWKEAERFKASLRPAPQPSYTPFQGTDPTTGNPVVRPFNTKTGAFGAPADVAPKLGASGLAAPMAAKVGQAGEMMKKLSDILPMMDKMTVSVGQSASADIAQNGLGVGHMRIPGTRGVGNVLVNQSPDYATYQATLTPFVLAAAHALSGARINPEQVTQIRQSIELAPGDIANPSVVHQKTKNLLDLVNSITGSLPADAMAEQEGQIDAASLSDLQKRGYKASTGRMTASPAGRGGPPPTAHGAAPSGNVDLRLSDEDRAHAQRDPAFASWLKSKGYTVP